MDKRGRSLNVPGLRMLNAIGWIVVLVFIVTSVVATIITQSAIDTFQANLKFSAASGRNAVSSLGNSAT